MALGTPTILAMSKQTTPTPTPTASTDKVERLNLAKVEHEAIKAWKKSGSKGDAPATPNLDAINADKASGGSTVKKSTKKSKSDNPRPERAEGITFMYNGKPVAHNFLARLAANLKMPVTDLRVELAAAGIETPEMQTWSLAIGEAVIGAVLPGDEVPADLAVIRSSRKAKVADEQPVEYAIVRTAARKYSALRNGVELDRPVDSAKKAQAIIDANGGPADLEVEDVREGAAA